MMGRSDRGFDRPAARRRWAPVAWLCLAATIAGAGLAAAGPYIWDEDGDRIDDRIETVQLLGYSFSFEGADSLRRQRIAVERAGGVLFFSCYVVYDHAPTDSDLVALTALGMPVLHRYESVPAVRTLGTYPQVAAAAAEPGVERVEAIAVLHPMLREATAAIGMRDPSERVFPTVAGTGGADGSGVVVAILDSGINDAPEGSYPGHESLVGRCVGGASFVGGDSLLDTPRDGSVNPSDHGGEATQGHGTHVASLVLGSGGSSGYAVGVAPGARFVDVKVLNDAGLGTGVAEALDWCVHNRARDWDATDAEGIDVINLSVSSIDPTDGNDVASRIANQAAAHGIVVVGSTGNDGEPARIPSPAGADAALAIGAFEGQGTALGSDDQVAAFSNYGPRAADGDAEPGDEQKPDLLAPGVAILGADGDLTSDGAQYRRMSGTSMAAALASGAVAVLRSAEPGLTPEEIGERLRATARRDLGGAPVGPPGSDPRWSAGMGFGALDLYAADLERAQPGRSQVVRLELEGAEDAIDVTLRTQREFAAGHFAFERAPDEGGVPGGFTAFDSVAAAGDSSLAGALNRHAYPRTWLVPLPERGAAFWYRVAYTESGERFATPARRFASPAGPSAATIELTIVHNALDHDVSASVSAGDPGAESAASAVVFPVPGTASAVASDWVTGTSTFGNVAWTFRIPVPQGEAEQHLPPSTMDPWRLDLEEAGYLNRSGRVTAFRIIRHLPSGDETYEGGPVPQQTIEGQTTSATAPQGLASVDAAPPGVRFGPNPVRAGDAVRFSLPSGANGDLRVFDVAGRLIDRVTTRPSDGAVAAAEWRARDAAGRALAPGIYLVRPAVGPPLRLVVVRP